MKSTFKKICIVVSVAFFVAAALALGRSLLTTEEQKGTMGFVLSRTPYAQKTQLVCSKNATCEFFECGEVPFPGTFCCKNTTDGSEQRAVCRWYTWDLMTTEFFTADDVMKTQQTNRSVEDVFVFGVERKEQSLLLPFFLAFIGFFCLITPFCMPKNRRTDSDQYESMV